MSSRKRKKNSQRPAPRKTKPSVSKGKAGKSHGSLKVVASELAADGGAEINADELGQELDSSVVAVSEITELRPRDVDAQGDSADAEDERTQSAEYSDAAASHDDEADDAEPDGAEAEEGAPADDVANEALAAGDAATVPEAGIVQEETVPESAPAKAAPASRAHLKRVLESLIFVSDSIISAQQLGRITKSKQAEVRELVAELSVDYEGRGIELVELAGGYQFRSAAVCAPFVRDLVAQRPVRLTRAQLETLALVAYRQPITRPEVDDVRGVDSGSAIKVLLERDLIKILGRKDEAGRPLLYGTAPYFLEFFGMKGMQDLPTLREFTELNEENRELFKRKTGEVPDLSAEAEIPLEHAPSGDDDEMDGDALGDIDALVADDPEGGARVVSFARGAARSQDDGGDGAEPDDAAELATFEDADDVDTAVTARADEAYEAIDEDESSESADSDPAEELADDDRDPLDSDAEQRADADHASDLDDRADLDSHLGDDDQNH